jgi:L,D-transpeptidase catalytic domain
MRVNLLRSVALVVLMVASHPFVAHAVPDPQTGGAAPAAAAAAAPSSPAAPAAPEAAEKPPAPKPVVVTLTADINLTAQQMTVSSGGKTLHVWPISSGDRDHPTPTGSFRPQWMARTWFSKQYDDAPMPHSVFFNGGIATHATQATHRLGTPASHGCVRLSPSAAATFYALVQKHGLASTRIVVRGSPKFRDVEVASSRRRRDDDGAFRSAAPRYDRPPGYAYARPVAPYGYAQPYRPAYGYYAPPPRVYEQRWPGDGPSQGEVRYIPRGYVRY